jgi:hypothetical protein
MGVRRIACIAVFVPFFMLLAACQGPPDLLSTLTSLPPEPKAAPEGKQGAPPPVHRAQCVMDFWGTCTPVAANRHPYRWRYVRPPPPGARTEPVKQAAPPPPRTAPAPRTEPGGGRYRETAASSNLCHPRRRVVGAERPSREDAQKAADDAWMSEVRYDFGERYQDLNRARDVRQNCTPSSVSPVLKTAHYRCVIEATPCRAPVGPVEERAAAARR